MGAEGQTTSTSTTSGGLRGLMATTSELSAVRTTRSESSHALLTGLSADGCAMALDETTGAWYCTVPSSPHMLRDWDPLVSWEGDEGVNVALRAFEPSERQVAQAQAVTLIAYTKTEWMRYELVLTTLPVLRLALPDGEVPTAETRDDDTRIELLLLDNTGDVVREVRSRGLMHVRGNSSARYPKAGFRLSLKEGEGTKEDENHKVSLLGMRTDDDWVLYAAYSDQEKLRNVFSTCLWYDTCATDNGWDVIAGTEYRFVELVLGDRYWGLYALGFPVDAKQLNIRGGDKWLFKKGDWTRSEARPWLFERGGAVRRAGYELKEGDPAGAWEVIRSYFSIMMADPRRLRVLADYDNALDLWLFLNLAAAVDNVGPEWSLNNNYLALTWRQDGAVRALNVPWDLDQTWGNIWREREDNKIAQMGVSATLAVRDIPLPVSRLRMVGDENVDAELAQRWWELRQGLWSDESLLARLDELERLVFGSGAFVRDRARWPQGNYTDPSKGASDMRQWLLDRTSYLDGLLLGERLP